MIATLVIYFTRTGNCRMLATRLSNLCSVEIREIIDLVDRSGGLGWIKAGASSAKGEKSPIDDPNVDLAMFTHIVIVQPMWAFSICPPVRTWVDAHKTELESKEIGLVVSYLGTNPSKIKTSFEKEFSKVKAFCAIPEKKSQEYKDNELVKFIAEFNS